MTKRSILLIALCIGLILPIISRTEIKVQGFSLKQDRGVGVRKNENFGQKRVALVIGNSAYQSAPLKNPVNDAKDIAQALKELGFSVNLQLDGTRDNILQAIEDFGEKIEPNTVVLFYYAGHGVQSNGENYLMPVNGDIKNEAELKYKAVEAGRVLAKMEGVKNTLNIVILDACRNNPFARSFRNANSGLAQMIAPTGTIIAYATDPGKTASDGDGRNGLYTQELLKAIKTPGLKIEDVFKRTAKNVNNLSNQQQRPWIASNFFDEFSFTGSLNSALPPINTNPTVSNNSATNSAASPDLATEKRAYDSYNAATAEKDLAKQLSMVQESLRLYPNSQYVKFFKGLLTANIGNRFQNEIKAENIDGAYRIFTEEASLNSSDLELNYLLAFLDPLSRFAKKPDTPYATRGTTILKQTIDLIKKGKNPTGVTVTDWNTKKPAVLASLYQTLGLYTWKANKNEFDALNIFKESISQDCSDPVTHYFVAELYKSKYDVLSKEFEALTDDDKRGDKGKEVLDKVNSVIDQMLESYAKTLAVSEGKAATYAKLRSGVQSATETFWKFRHEDSVAGLTEYINSFKGSCR